MELDLTEDHVLQFPCGGFGQNVLIFGADMSSSGHIDNKKKDILVIGKEPTQGLEHTDSRKNVFHYFYCDKKNCLGLYYNGANSYLFVNGTEIYKLLQFRYVQEKILKYWSVDNMNKTGFTGYIYDFSADYDAITVDDVKDIHKYLMKKNKIV